MLSKGATMNGHHYRSTKALGNLLLLSRAINELFRSWLFLTYKAYHFHEIGKLSALGPTITKKLLESLNKGGDVRLSQLMLPIFLPHIFVPFASIFTLVYRSILQGRCSATKQPSPFANTPAFS